MQSPFPPYTTSHCLLSLPSLAGGGISNECAVRRENVYYTADLQLIIFTAEQPAVVFGRELFLLALRDWTMVAPCGSVFRRTVLRGAAQCQLIYDSVEFTGREVGLIGRLLGESCTAAATADGSRSCSASVLRCR